MECVLLDRVCPVRSDSRKEKGKGSEMGKWRGKLKEEGERGG